MKILQALLSVGTIALVIALGWKLVFFGFRREP